MCSATCGPGTKVRTRECDSPAPRYGGECTGNGQETAPCTIRPCPISKYKQRNSRGNPVSYTHLTLPTIYSV